MAAPVAHPAAWTGTDVRIPEIARRLRDLRSMSGDESASTLTSVMNLVILANSAERAAEAEAIVDTLADHHPSRVIIVVPADGLDGIDARVELMSHTARGTARTLVVEQVVLTVRGAVAAHAGSAVIPLLRSELPTFFWWPVAPEPGSAAFLELARIADRLVTEVGRDLPGPQALTRLAALIDASAAPVTDLAWAIVTPWRQLLASSVRGEALLRLRAGRAGATVTTRAGGPSLEALLLAGWLQDVVGDHLKVDFAHGDGGDDVIGVRLTADSPVVTLTRDAGAPTVTLSIAQRGGRCHPLPPPDRREILAGELELRGHDRALERAVANAVRLSASNRG